MATRVVGRARELATLESFLDGVSEGPSVLGLAGEAGIGKTILLEAGAEMARRRSWRVLSCRGSEVEASYAFAGLSDLLLNVLDEARAWLAPPRRRALEVALLLEDPGEDAPDLHAIGLALLDVVRMLASAGPVVIVIDDTQWLDSSSSAALLIALRRLRGAGVGVLEAVRGSGFSDLAGRLATVFPDERATQLLLAPLTAGALHQLLKERLSLELSRPQLMRLHRASGGNPFFALELAVELRRDDARPAGSALVHVPASLRDLLGARFGRLSTETADALLCTAALSRPTLGLLTQALGGTAVEALEPAAQEGIIEVEGAVVRFGHPLLASVCYEQAPLVRRREIHAALARVVPDVEERARHLALAAAGPDAAVAAEVEAAAGRAAGRGATDAAAELAELAAELSSEAALARRRKLRAATFHRLAGDAEQAARILHDLLALMPAGVERTDVLFELALARTDDPRALVDLCSEALAEAAGDDVRSARILAYRSWLRQFQPAIGDSLADARAALDKAERVGQPALLAQVIAQVGQIEPWAGELTPGLLERGVEIEEALEVDLEFPQSPRIAFARLLMRLGALDRSRAILAEAEKKAAAGGDERTRGHLLWSLTRLEWLAGRWSRALELAATARELAEQTQDEHTFAFAQLYEALVEADLGLVDEARASAEQGLAAARAAGDAIFELSNLAVLGRVELALGNLDTAAEYLRELPARRIALGWNDPVDPVWADAIETLTGLGELEQARAYLEHFELGAERLASAWAIESGARCRGLVSAAAGDVDGTFASFERALRAPGEQPYPFERGRTWLSLGIVRRQAQQKRAARDALEQSRRIFEELGARLWAEKAGTELRRIGGRRPTPTELTGAEQRVAELAAEGRSNKEIASELFMGLSTVEAHLSRVYRKLGIRSRAGLAARLSRAGPPAGKPREEAAQS